MAGQNRQRGRIGTLHTLSLALVLTLALLLVAKLPVGGASVALAATAPVAEERLTEDDWPPSREALRGRVVYEENCVGCHGTEGLGDGTATAFLDPLPRNFQRGQFKFRTTATGEWPLDSDLIRTVTWGLPGSSMPGFPLVPDSQRRDVVAYVLYLASLGRARTLATAFMHADELTLDDFRRNRMDSLRAMVLSTTTGGRHAVSTPASWEDTPAMLARGKTDFEAQCASCHGTDGRGGGPSSDTLRDWQDAPIRPRDFTTGVFRGGNTQRDLLLRMRCGLNGTPMPASPSDTDEKLQAIVAYVRSLTTPGLIPVTRRMGAPEGR